METVRCIVECWADFSDLHSAIVIRNGTELFLATGTSDVFVFNGKAKRVETIMHFYSPVRSMALSEDRCRLYALCENDGLYCIPVTLESSIKSLSETCRIPVLSTVSRDSAVIKDGRVQSFLVVESVLVTVSMQGSFWTFDLYQVSNCSEGATVYRQHGGFQVPVVYSSKAKIPQKQTVDTVDSKTAAPTLACIYPSSDRAPKGQAHEGNLLLEPLIFRLLFGVDASLVHSPVILCGLPDGRLFFFPLLLPVPTSLGGEQKPQIRMLYRMEQPVTFIGTSVTGEKGPKYLVVIGQRGKILIARASHESSDGKTANCSFIEHTVRGPVECACVHGECLYYSTSTNLLAFSLINTSASPSPPRAAVGEEISTRPASAICLGVCRVAALAEPCVTPAGCVELLALSLSGKLLQVTVPHASDKESQIRTPYASAQVGQRVKDLLNGIGNVWERASSMKHQLQLKNNTLRCLNQVFNICHMLLDRHKNDPHSKAPISCRGVASWSTLLQKDSLIFTCILENLSDCALEQGWTLCTEILSSHSHSADSSSTTYSFALKKVDCGETLEVTLPLNINGEVSLPVTINCYLVYSLQSLFYPEELRHLSATSDLQVSQVLKDNGCISLALNTLTLDWLDCLRIGEPNSCWDVPKQMTPWEATRIFLSSRQTQTEHQPMPETGPRAVTVRISSELLRTGLRLHECGSEVLCTSLLKWLVSGISEAGEYMLVQGPMVCALGPSRCTVRLLTKEVIVSGISCKGPLSVVELQVESSSMEALCGLHHAVLRRVQALLKDNPVTEGDPVRLSRQHLNEAVQHAESLYKDLQDSRTRDVFSGLIKRRKTSELFQLYLQLRKHPLVIL